MTAALAYIDTRPFIFTLGLLVSWLLSLWINRATKGRYSLVTVLAYGVVAGSALYGPYVGREELKESKMSWYVGAKSPGDPAGTKVTLTFLDYPHHHLVEFSDDLAEHLSKSAKDHVSVKFKVTTDYGKVRGFQMIEIDGMTHWRSEGAYLEVTGESTKSLWD